MTDKTQYSGRLAPHIDLITYMARSGFSSNEIAWHLHKIKNVPTTDPVFWLETSNLSSLAGLVTYVLRRTETRRPPKRNPRYFDIAPKNIAASQIRWERQQVIKRMQSVGLTHVEIAKRVGLTSSRVGQMLKQRIQSTAPIQKWLSEPLTGKIGPLGRATINQMTTCIGRDWLLVGSPPSTPGQPRPARTQGMRDRITGADGAQCFA